MENQEQLNKVTHCSRCRLHSAYLYDEKRKCWYCPVCTPLQKEVAKVKEKERHYVDVRLTEARVKKLIKETIAEIVPEMIQDGVEKFYIPSTETDMAKKVLDKIIEDPTTYGHLLEPEIVYDKHKNWRSEAKELGIPLAQPTGGARKKVDVLKDIEEKLNPLIAIEV